MFKFLLQKLSSHPSSSSFLLIGASILAVCFANSPLKNTYATLIHSPLPLFWHTNLHFVVNEGLMTLFFLVLSLEVKEELFLGELNSISKALLPFIAAIGGMIVPAVIYLLFNSNGPSTLGWAIPTATDVAFSLAILSFIPHLPSSLKIFLSTLAIIDDIGAIIIIAFFYTFEIHWLFLALALLFILCLRLFVYLQLSKKFIFFPLGIIIWWCFIKAHIHPSIAGVLIAFSIPLIGKNNTFKKLKKNLTPCVNYFILPLFAFCNLGIFLPDLHFSMLFHPVCLGIIFGLCLGKPLGVFSFSWFAIKMKIATLPYRMNFRSLLGISILCGIGFTMSLFIGTLAFSLHNMLYLNLVKIAVIVGSLLSALLGYALLTLKKMPS